MKVLLSPNAFKESLSAHEACMAMKDGIRKNFPQAEIFKLPLADGGDGTIDALSHIEGMQTIRKKVTGPLGAKVNAKFLFWEQERTAIVEMAQASGLELVPMIVRNPMETTTFMSGSLAASSCATKSSLKVLTVTALNFLGRLRVIQSTPSFFS